MCVLDLMDEGSRRDADGQGLRPGVERGVGRVAGRCVVILGFQGTVLECGWTPDAAGTAEAVLVVVSCAIGFLVHSTTSTKHV